MPRTIPDTVIRPPKNNMPTINITTTQKVVIQYELASLRDRVLAFLIDAMIVYGGAFMLLILYNSMIGSESLQYFMYFVLLPLIIGYMPVSESLSNGQSWGKQAMGIKVANIHGKEPVVVDYLIRWVFRLIDIGLTLGALGAFLISSTEKRQRLGGLLSDTTVIRIRPDLELNLRDIRKINTLDNYEIKYPGARQFREKDMLLVKKVLERVKKHPNAAHREALDQLVGKIAAKLELADIPEDKTGFLNQLLNDYIVLTR